MNVDVVTGAQRRQRHPRKVEPLVRRIRNVGHILEAPKRDGVVPRAGHRHQRARAGFQPQAKAERARRERKQVGRLHHIVERIVERLLDVHEHQARVHGGRVMELL